MTQNDLELTTVQLLSRSWEEIYGVLAKINDAAKAKPNETKQILINKPAFARALFQAQLELGIANLDSEQEPPKIEEDEDYQNVLEQVRTMTKKEFDELNQEAQMYVMRAREGLHLPPKPTE